MIKFYELMCLGDVSRWNIVKHVKPQSVAEHSFLTTVIALELCRLTATSGLYPHVMMTAMFHDATEAIIGDVPTPAKLLVGREHFQRAEAKLGGAIYALTLPDALPSEWDWVHAIVKIADLIEAYVWIADNGVGGRAEVVKMDIRARLTERVSKLSAEESEDMFPHVNAILTTLGVPYIHYDERVSP